MKIRKKISLLLMACVTAAGLLAGCGLNGEDSQKNTEGFASTQSGKGRFVESEITLPENIRIVNAVGKSKGEELTLIGGDGDKKLFLAHSNDQGKTWSQTKLGQLDNYVSAVNGEDGSAVVFGYNKKSGMQRVAADGKITKVNLPLPEYKGSGNDTENFITSAVFAGNKLFVTDLNWVVYEVNPKTGEMREILQNISEDVTRLLAAGKTFGLVTDKGIQFVDAESGTLAENMQNDNVLQEAMNKVSESHNINSSSIAMTMGDSEDELYYVNHE